MKATKATKKATKKADAVARMTRAADALDRAAAEIGELRAMLPWLRRLREREFEYEALDAARARARGAR